MMTLKIGENEYKLEFSFEAAENKDIVQKMFNVLSGAYVVRKSKTVPDEEDGGNKNIIAMVDGVAEMVADIPHICIDAFYAGLLEHNPESKEDAKKLLRQYMKENKKSYNDVYEDVKKCMEDDGFFDLSGLTAMLNQMSEQAQEKAEMVPKKPQDHKKSTSTK